jgi:replicative DNA helicase
MVNTSSNIAGTTFPARRTYNEQRAYLNSFADLYEKLAPKGLVPPAELAYEQAILGAMMIDISSRKKAIEIIGERNPFYRDAHADIYRAAFALQEKGEPVDPITIKNQLAKMGALESVGGPAYLVELMAATVTTVNIASYARIIIEKYLSRELIRVCEEIKLRAFEGEMDVFNLIDEAEAFVGDIAAQRRDAQGYFGTTVFRLRDFKERYVNLFKIGLVPGLSTAFKRSFTTADGKEIYTIERGTVTLITGIPSHGKSAFIDNVTIPLAKDHDWKIAMSSPEMLPLELHAASLAEIYTGEPFNTGHTSRMSEQSMLDAGDFIDQHYFFFVAPEMPFSVDALLERATSLALREGISGLVIDPWNHLDHGMESDERGDIYLKRNLLKIKMWAVRMKVWVAILAHPTKLRPTGAGEPVPTPYDVKGGSEWFDMMDFCLAVWRDKKDERKPSQILVQKCRYRHLGALGLARLDYNKPCGQFQDSLQPASSVILKEVLPHQGKPPSYPTPGQAPPGMQEPEDDI